VNTETKLSRYSLRFAVVLLATVRALPTASLSRAILKPTRTRNERGWQYYTRTVLVAGKMMLCSNAIFIVWN